MKIDRADDARLADYVDVVDARWLRERRLFLAEGRKTVRALIEAPDYAVRSVLATETALEGLGDLVHQLGDSTPVYCASREVIAQTSGVRFHQGCVAAGERARVPTLEALLGAAPSDARVLVLEQVTDPDNVGGIFRSALAFGISAVLLSPGCAPPLYRKAVRTSLGAVLALPFCELVDWPADLDRLRDADFRLLALTPAADAADLDAFGRERAVPERLALVLGTEGEGLSGAVLARADAAVRIPMDARADSLNVATAAAIAMHHVRPRRER